MDLLLNFDIIVQVRAKKWSSVETDDLNDCLPYENLIYLLVLRTFISLL